MDVLQVLFSLWTGNRCTTEQPESIKKLTAEEQHEIRAYCENNERQAFDVGFKTAVQLWNQLDIQEESWNERRYYLFAL